jgi:hypothetical protein
MEIKKKIRTSGKGLTDFKRMLKYQLSKTDLNKVTDMVGTFSNENSYGFQVSAIQRASQKVAATVATFLTNC